MIMQGSSLEAVISAVSQFQAWFRTSQDKRETYIKEVSLMLRRARYRQQKVPMGALQLRTGVTTPSANMILSAHIAEGSYIDLYAWDNDTVSVQLNNCIIDFLIAIMDDLVDSGTLG